MTYHVLQDLLLLVMSLHVPSMAGGHVLLQFVQGLQLLSTGVTQVLHKVIACLHPKTLSTVIVREATGLLRQGLTVLGAVHLVQTREHQRPDGRKRQNEGSGVMDAGPTVL